MIIYVTKSIARSDVFIILPINCRFSLSMARRRRRRKTCVFANFVAVRNYLLDSGNRKRDDALRLDSLECVGINHLWNVV